MRLVSLRTQRRKLAVAAIAAVALAGTGTAIVAGGTAFAAAACSVTYTSSPWTSSPGSGGFTTNITLANPGDPMTTWTLRVTLPAGQVFSNGWSANWTASGTALTATNMSWNAPLATGASTSFGFQGTWTGSYSNPTAFTVNGVACNGAPPTSSSPSASRSASPTASPSRSATASPTPSRTTASPTPSRTTSSPTPSSCTTNCPPHVDNPFAGATGYVNPDWRSKANAEPGGSRVSNQPTGVWLDRIAAIAGSSTSMGLRAHMDAAVTQDAANGATPLYAQFVIYDLPNRDCSALASNGELKVAENGLNRYKTEYIDQIANILADSKYSAIRIVLIIEIDSLPNLITNTNLEKCQEAASSGAYVQGIQYALSKFHALTNVYNYIDAAHHGWIGWPNNFNGTADLLSSTAAGAVGGRDTVDGFIVNTANYSALVEPFFTANTTVGGQQVKNVSTWVGFNDYVDELNFAQAFRTKLTGAFGTDIGMLIDTSRNGWGNCVQAPCAAGAGTSTNRPTAASTSTDPNTFINQSRVDRRIHAGNWCNQAGAGLGERPRANPATGIDAYVWIKPPGESDGSSSLIDNDQGKGFDRMCDPTYDGNDRNGMSKSGALPNAPISGAWFSAQFQQLMANAFPPL